ncbi:uncharacterized protein LOC115033320 [Acyrthosiphon pisum]|uniref:Uncharacterized protein n=1 Tax=Acyrthosiphon pisum TaxID=7029 RepID=A0A8R2NJY9_ACYPI|nr:uncharacterized protein LOC115033320 [Acyrthosiphon pisum]
MAIPITTVTTNLGASNAVETTAPRTAQRTELVQPNVRYVLRYTRPTTKDTVFINPLQKKRKNTNVPTPTKSSSNDVPGDHARQFPRKSYAAATKTLSSTHRSPP